VEPAALLTRAGEHVPQRGPRAEGAFTDTSLGSFTPRRLRSRHTAAQLSVDSR
jgi:hypothetical protein